MRMFQDFLAFAAASTVAILVFAARIQSQEMDYSLIQNLGIQCTGRHSCADGSINRNFSLRNCECDHRCDTYDDCCIDSDGRSSRTRRPNAKPLYRCVEEKKSMPLTGVHAVTKCKSGWNGPAFIRDSCEGERDNMTDPVLAAPATDSSGRTYRNLYCVECNDVESSSVTLWEVMISCNLRTENKVSFEYIKENLVYSEGKWGINYRNGTSRNPKFHPCDLGFGLPRSVDERKVRRCRPGLISTCPKSYKRPNERRLCASYTAVVYTNSGVFKNPHCGSCNGVSLNKMKCFQSDLHVTDKNTRPMAFALIFDINLRDGPTVGTTQKCQNGEIWDDSFRKCRSRLCILPGRKLVNGKCVK